MPIALLHADPQLLVACVGNLIVGFLLLQAGAWLLGVPGSHAAGLSIPLVDAGSQLALIALAALCLSLLGQPATWAANLQLFVAFMVVATLVLAHVRFTILGGLLCWLIGALIVIGCTLGRHVDIGVAQILAVTLISIVIVLVVALDFNLRWRALTLQPS